MSQSACIGALLAHPSPVLNTFALRWAACEGVLPPLALVLCSSTPTGVIMLGCDTRVHDVAIAVTAEGELLLDWYFMHHRSTDEVFISSRALHVSPCHPAMLCCVIGRLPYRALDRILRVEPIPRRSRQ